MMLVVSVLSQKHVASSRATGMFSAWALTCRPQSMVGFHNACECQMLVNGASQGNYNRSRAITYSQLFDSSIDATLKPTTPLIQTPTTRCVPRRIHLTTPTSTSTSTSTWPNNRSTTTSPRSPCFEVSWSLPPESPTTKTSTASRSSKRTESSRTLSISAKARMTTKTTMKVAETSTRRHPKVDG